MANNTIGNLHYMLADKLSTDINPDGFKELKNTVEENDRGVIKIIGQEAFDRIEEFLNATAAANEHYGFVAGFIYATRLLTEARPTLQDKYMGGIQ